MSKGLKDFCSITKYLETYDAPLFKLYDNFCLLSQFYDREKKGITFLHPGKKYVKVIADMAYSKNKPHDAIAHLKSFIIKTYIKDVSGFNSELKNSIGVKVGITKSDSNSASCGCGLTIKAQPKFKKLYENGEYNIFQLSDNGVFDIKEAKSGGMQTNPKKEKIQEIGNKRSLIEYVEDSYANGYTDIYKIVIMLSEVDKSSDTFVQCATARATFYANLELFNKVSDATIKKFTELTQPDVAGSLTGKINEYDSRVKDFSVQNTKTLSAPVIKGNDQNQIWNDIKATYLNHYVDKNLAKQRLYADLMTVLCFICANNELQDTKDDKDPKSEYKTSSVKILKSYSSRGDFKPSGDIARDYTLLSLLYKSNVYCWPSLANDSKYRPENYDPHSNPMHLQYFDIIKHNATTISGGNNTGGIFD
jgi:hypothetical protein